MKPVVLLILDGWGISRAWEGNAVTRARTPNFTRLAETYPFFSLQASGIAVGLPWAEPGNSEVGHLTLGSGRTVMQYLPRIVEAIFDGSFFTNPALVNAVKAARANNGRLHLAGLVSSGTVHAYLDHLYGLIELAEREGMNSVYLHVFTDGMDSPPHEAEALMGQLEERLKKTGRVSIASLSGRAYAMNRSNEWELTQKAFEAILGTDGLKAQSVGEAFAAVRSQTENDAAFPPTVITDADAQPIGALRSGDGLIFFNFREDGIRQLAQAFLESDFRGFARPAPPTLSQAVTLTEYDANLPAAVAFPPPRVEHTLAELLSRAGKTQLHLAEEEKYAHVTFFFNAWRREALPGEVQRLVSRAYKNVRENPAMGVEELAKIIESALEAGTHDFIAANLANADVLAHSGDLEATIRGIEHIDGAIRGIAESVLKQHGLLIITADHGHAEEMLNPFTREIITEHTAYPVPLIVVHETLEIKNRAPDWTRMMREPDGVLTDVAPIVLSFLDIEQPPEMTGEALISF
jgi:2,3-bisphosphoglycerate-independent phosphoglycerate mutase